MDFDENDDEVWRSWCTETVPSLAEALRLVATDGSWVFFYPIAVHPEYRAPVLELVQDAAGRLPEGRREMWERRSQDWQHRCEK
jgi:hypothetical protein